MRSLMTSVKRSNKTSAPRNLLQDHGRLQMVTAPLVRTMGGSGYTCTRLLMHVVLSAGVSDFLMWLQIDQVYFPHIEVVGDIANALWQMSQALEGCEPQWDLRYASALATYPADCSALFLHAAQSSECTKT